MTKKFLPFVILSIFSCEDKPKTVPARNENAPNFEADPNEYNYFENHLNELITFVSDSLKKEHYIPDQMKKCIEYAVRYEKWSELYEYVKGKQFLSQHFNELICTLASYHRDMLDDEILDFKERNNRECPMEKVVKEVYESSIKKITEIKEENKNGQVLHRSEVFDMMKNALCQFLQSLMETRADTTFLVAMAIIFRQKLSVKLLDEKDFCKQLDDDPDDNPEDLRRIFLDELAMKEIIHFTPDVCKTAQRSQFDIFINKFENYFHNKKPSISFQNVIRPYLEKDENKDYVIENLKVGVKEFFKKNYQKYFIHFQECTFNLLTKYLRQVVNNKREVGEFLVLYFLNFYSTKTLYKNFVFSNMGQEMLRYEPFADEKAETFNKNIDEIVKFINDNYKEMNGDLFKEVTKKKIENGNRKIVEELIEQLNIGKRF